AIDKIGIPANAASVLQCLLALCQIKVEVNRARCLCAIGNKVPLQNGLQCCFSKFSWTAENLGVGNIPGRVESDLDGDRALDALFERCFRVFDTAPMDYRRRTEVHADAVGLFSSLISHLRASFCNLCRRFLRSR